MTETEQNGEAVLGAGDVDYGSAAMRQRHSRGMREYRWLSFAYLSYAICALGAIAVLPLSDALLFSLVILLTVMYLGALLGLAVRALRRIEERIDLLLV